MENMFRDLKSEEIDVRIAQVKQNGTVVRKAFQRLKKEKQVTVLKEQDSIGELEENFIQHRLYGYLQKNVKLKKIKENMLVMISFLYQKYK